MEPLSSLQEPPQAQDYHQSALYEPHAAVTHEDLGLAPSTLDGNRGIPILDDFSSQRNQLPTYGQLQKENVDLNNEELDDFDRQLLASDQAFNHVHAASERNVPTSDQHDTQLVDRVRQEHAFTRKTPILKVQEHHDRDDLTHFWQPHIRY